MPAKKQLEEAERLASQVDWSKLDALSDAAIREGWAWDKDAAWPTEAELADYDLVIPAEARRRRTAAGSK